MFSHSSPIDHGLNRQLNLSMSLPNIVNMTFLNENTNIRQFGLVKFMNENSSDEHVISKISIVLRRDKIEAPYYMSTVVKLSSCLDMPERGMFHAMDMLNFHRMHNLTEEKYNQIRTLK